MTAPMPPSALQVVGDVLLYGGSMTAVIFCLYYTWHAKWWRSEAGVFMIASSAYTALLLIFLSAIIATTIPADSAVRMWMRAIIYGLAIPLSLWKISMLHRAQKSGYEKPITMRTPLDVPGKDS